MKKEDFENLPYQSRMQLLDLRHKLLGVIKGNSDVIKLIENDPLVFSCRSINNKYSFDILSTTFNKKIKIITLSHLARKATSIIPLQKSLLKLEAYLCILRIDHYREKP